MIRYFNAMLMLALFSGSAAAQAPAAAPAAAPATGPTVVVETSRGTFEFVTFPDTAPKTVAHIVALVKKNFYNGQRIHRVVAGFVVQFGDPNTRDLTKKEMWGSGGSGTPIGVAEMSKVHTHDKKGMVAMAHAGNPAKADSQMYVTLSARPQLDKDYTVFGEITSGMDIVEKTVQDDVIKRVTVKGAAAAAAPATKPAATPAPKPAATPAVPPK